MFFFFANKLSVFNVVAIAFVEHVFDIIIAVGDVVVSFTSRLFECLLTLFSRVFFFSLLLLNVYCFCFVCTSVRLSVTTDIAVVFRVELLLLV